MPSDLFKAYEPKPPPMYAVYVTEENIEQLARDLPSGWCVTTRLERGFGVLPHLVVKDGDEDEVCVRLGEVLVAGKPWVVMSRDELHHGYREYLDARQYTYKDLT